MSSLLKLRRGSTISHAGFTGADGEVTFNTDTNALVSHDGATAGGFPHVKASDLASTVGTGQVGHLASTLQDKLEGFKTPTDSAAPADGLSDANAKLQSLLATGKSLHFLGGTYLNSSSQNGLNPPSDSSIVGDFNTELRTSILNWRSIDTDTTGPRRTNINVIGMKFSGNTNNTDDWAPLRIGATKGSLVFGNNVTQSFYGITIGYSYYNDKADRYSSEVRVIGNLSHGSGTGYEIFSTHNSSVVGNVAIKYGAQATNHGYRVVGYGAAQSDPGVDLRNYGTAFAGNTANNFGNGISQQAGVYAASYAAISLTDCGVGIQSTPSYSAENVSKGNTFSAVAIDGTPYGIILERPEKQVISGVAMRNTSQRGWDARVANSPGAYGTGKYNRFSGLIADHSGNGEAARFEVSNSRIDITVADLSASGSVGVRIAGNFNIVTITGGGSPSTLSAFLEVSGHNNIITIAGDGIAQAFSEVVVSGSRNEILASLDRADGGGKVTITGSANKLYGACGLGTISAGNDISGVAGCSGYGAVSATTDAAGDVVITHGLIATPTFASVQVTGVNALYATVHSITSYAFRARFFNSTGNPLASASVSGLWSACRDRA